MTSERRNRITAMVMLSAGVMATLYVGILAGLREDWMRMSLHLFAFTFLVFCCTTGLVGMSLGNRLTRLEDRFRIDRKQVPRGARCITRSVGFFMILSVPLQMTLSIIVGFRGDWFRFGIYLTACVITVIICMGTLTSVHLGMRLARLEQPPADTLKAENA